MRGSGFAVAIACVARRSLGQEYADGALAGVPNHSWHVGNDRGDETHGATDGSYGFYMQGTGETPILPISLPTACPAWRI